MASKTWPSRSRENYFNVTSRREDRSGLEHHAHDKPSEGRGAKLRGLTDYPIEVLFEYLFGLRFDARRVE